MLVVLAGWINRQQQLIEFQDAQIKILLERQGRKRLLLIDETRSTFIKAHWEVLAVTCSHSPVSNA